MYLIYFKSIEFIVICYPLLAGSYNLHNYIPFLLFW